MAPSMFSISMSVLRKSHDFLMVDLVPLRHINADLRSANEVLARIHEIVNNNNNNDNNNEYLYRITHQCKSTVIKGVLSKIT